jgi:phage terminase large subunit GpA-like protein
MATKTKRWRIPPSSKLSSAYKTALGVLYLPRLTTPDEWAAQNRVYPPSSSIPGPRDPYLTPYSVHFSRAMTAGAWKRVVMVCSAQMGKTEAHVDVIGAIMDQRPRPIVYVGPTRDFVSDIFEPRLMQLFDEAPGLARKLLRGKKNKKTQKYISGVPIRLAWAGSSAQLKSFSCPTGFIDELDEMSRGVRDQGSVLELVEARGATYPDFKVGVTSTPSRGTVEQEKDEKSGLTFWKKADPEAVSSPIWRLWQSGTRHHWAWPCPHCDTFFVPMFRHLSWPEGASPAEARRSAHLVCDSCGCVIEEKDKPAMNARGVPVAPGQWIEDGEVYGDPEDNTTWSLWVSGLCSPFQAFGDRAADYLTAMESGDHDKIQTTFNACFGEVYGAIEGQAREWTEVFALRDQRNYGEVPEEACVLTAGVDVQGNRLVYSVRAWGANQTSWQIESGELFGNTSKPDVWKDLDDVLNADYAGKRISIMFVDSGYNTDQVYEFARLRKRRVYACKGVSHANAQSKTVWLSTIDVRQSGKQMKFGGMQIANVNTDMAKTWIHGRIGRTFGAPGSWMLADTADEAFCRQIVAEVRVEKSPGKYEWVRRDRDNHFLDTSVYEYAAACLWGLHTNPRTRSVKVVTKDAPAQSETTEPDTTAPLASMRSFAAAVMAPPSQPAMDPVRAMRERFAAMARRINR